MLQEYKLPGLDILKKYKYSITKIDDNITSIEVSGIIPHFDRQRLFGMCWRQDTNNEHMYYYNNILALRKHK